MDDKCYESLLMLLISKNGFSVSANKFRVTVVDLSFQHRNTVLLSRVFHLGNITNIMK